VRDARLAIARLIVSWSTGGLTDCSVEANVVRHAVAVEIYFYLVDAVLRSLSKVKG
jgi:hypothetical protein